ncbi:UDP-N-acetylmuramyl peptide synthase [Alicyclobacillus contaminans]|uniref:Mur ligase family protein n=1 Tax=Alicyclobacillus contaminans TaxID=392016 RepID=UPI0004081217|nr:Mur ligase family protein [Alicyclobacillus contaminans]GMA49455.1 UDP-N-acetylmuramyl peptide synthase [Alicyclobacillus contaminans]
MFGIWVGKWVLWILNILGKRATSLPGKVALRISPRLLEKLGAKLERCIVVTGTNGKTTTARLLAAAMAEEDAIVHNREGANLPQGLATALLKHCTWTGRLRCRTALFEIDEATLPLVAHALPIKVVVVTNVFRDQLDRYGELDTTLEKLLDGLRRTDAVAVLNADDPLARHIGLAYGKQVVYFGMSKDQLQHEVRDQMRDGAFCLECGHELVYHGFFYGQLGDYHCPQCGMFRPHPDFVGHPHPQGLTVSEGSLPEVTIALAARGLFNRYNALAALAAARVVGLDIASVQAGFRRYEPPLGRMQAFETSPPTVLNLIKNPTGCDSVLQTIRADGDTKVVCIAINDNAADGKDVSWLWDADFELLTEDPKTVRYVTTGLRAEDMALRLKYAGCPTDAVVSIPDLATALDEALLQADACEAKTVYVLSTYTALYPIADRLQRRAHSHEPSPAYRPSVS